MAREAKSGGDGVDIDSLRQLLELMEKHDVGELKLQRGDARYVIRRGPAAPSFPMGMPGQFFAPPALAAGPAPAARPASAPAGPAPAAAPAADNGLTIKSPTVGTFYLSPSPGEAAFVKVGDAVKPASIVCIVEAMKVFNQIPAGVTGTISRILVADGDAVEYGQPLFQVTPS